LDKALTVAISSPNVALILLSLRYSAGYVPDCGGGKGWDSSDFLRWEVKKVARLDEIVETPDQKVELD